ncbi:uncharacterized protein LOC143614764 [Bidens hawaiensis]|uniref:uncharacterized protein LOC143614764 n=1 Tax=Bidens hawaiensis TaxID=980011 RepID=UPI00404A8193
MRDEDPLPVSASSLLKKETLDSSSRRGRYKFWILSAIVLLAFWSVFTLHLSLGNLNRLTEEFTARSPVFDVLEIEEREKVVKHMWDVYTNNRRIKLPRFWKEAFVAAYEELTSDEPEVREAAISEIAKMSFHSAVDLHPSHLHSTLLYVCNLFKRIDNGKQDSFQFGL